MNDLPYRPNPLLFGVRMSDPGFIYLFEDRGRFKIGKTTAPASRMRAAKTWSPDGKLVGCKPFWEVSRLERDLHAALSSDWYVGEWFVFQEEEWRDYFISEFKAFSDTDRDVNSVNFIYWMNGTGMAEFLIARESQGLSLARFLRSEATNSKAGGAISE